jgi:hypothetical protein
VKALGFDLVSNRENLENIRRFGFPKDKVLIAGVINGRQVWRACLDEKGRLVEELSRHAKDVVIANSCPFFHLPVSVEPENELEDELKEAAPHHHHRLFPTDGGSQKGKDRIPQPQAKLRRVRKVYKRTDREGHKGSRGYWTGCLGARRV